MAMAWRSSVSPLLMAWSMWVFASGGVGDHGVGGIWAEGLVEEQDAEVAEDFGVVGLAG